MSLPSCPKCRNGGFSIWSYTNAATGVVRLLCCTRCHSIVRVITPEPDSELGGMDAAMREIARRVGDSGEVL